MRNIKLFEYLLNLSEAELVDILYKLYVSNLQETEARYPTSELYIRDYESIRRKGDILLCDLSGSIYVEVVQYYGKESDIMVFLRNKHGADKDIPIEWLNPQIRNLKIKKAV
jgi:hypothetical protein